MSKTAEIFCIGTEVLIGDIVNTNAAYISRRLSETGINVYHHTVCGDNPERIKKCLDIAFDRSDIVVTTGGLGPTYDDITKEIIASKLGLEMYEDKEVLARITSFFDKRGLKMTENNRKQALIPKGAVIFENIHGTADGIALQSGGKTVIMLPGPPREMEPMLENSVIPYLKSFSDHILVSSNVHIFGIGESTVESLLSDLMKSSVNPTVAPYVNAGEVRLRVTASGKTESEAKKLISETEKKISDILGNYVYGIDVPSIEYVLVNKLLSQNKKIAFAESCTGGLISKRLTDVPGASGVFCCGFVTYSNEAKTKMLGVSESTLKAYGAVSVQTACEMASGAMSKSGSDIALSVTGVAGPSGGTEEKPVGTVCIGIAVKGKGARAKKLFLGGHKGNQRDFIRTLTASNAFKTALDELDGIS
ncbi:MAG: competence/damage-inducible protein A [Clostridia bacterium]|nr:competence/damage-inducible protein A [Clostridia bacterium]